MRHAVRALVVLGLALVPVLAATATANAGYVGISLSRGSYLTKGNWIQSYAQEGNVRLIMQSDGNLVLIHLSTGRACWSTGTAGRGRNAVYQRDGNFVVVDTSGRAIWASNTVSPVSPGNSTVSINPYGRLYVGSRDISRRTCP